MKQTHYLLKGTFLLTAAGLLSRAAGFFYKIFLSRTIGAEQIGLYSLCMPVCAFCMAAASGGIQTAVSRFTAEASARADRRDARRGLLCSLALSIGLSLVLSALLFLSAPWIAASFLLDPRCQPLLRIAAASLPFCAVHNCVCGYFIGKKQVQIPAASQLLEQFLRIAAVLFFYAVFSRRGQELGSSVMMLGQVAGELAAALFCLVCLAFADGDAGKTRSAQNLDAPEGVRTAAHIERSRTESPGTMPSKGGATGSILPAWLLPGIRRILQVSTPLSLTRMLMGVLQAIEASLLPLKLRAFGLNASRSLSIYGTLSGMVLPLLFFPTAITGSVGSLLLPLVSEARAMNQEERITRTTGLSFRGSLLLGCFFLCIFFLFGEELGLLLFHSALAGTYIRRLSLVCPFLYLGGTLNSVLHGIGKTAAASAQNIFGFLVRLAFTAFLVPQGGISAYFLGLLAGQAVTAVCGIFTLCRQGSFRPSPAEDFLKPVLLCTLTIASVELLQHCLPVLTRNTWPALLSSTALCILIFGALLVLSHPFLEAERPPMGHT